MAMSSLALILLMCVQAWMIADLLSGIFHWLEDRYGNPDWPIIGKYVVQPNLLHHTRPAALCEGGYWNRNNTTIITSAIGAACFYWSPMMLIAFAILSQANEVHSWAHQKCNGVIRALQKIGVLQSPRHHSIHHRRPFDRYYCVMTNYLNPVLNLVGFWLLLESIVWVVTGYWPRPERELA